MLHENKLEATSSYLIDADWRKIRVTEGELIDNFLLPYVANTFSEAIVKEAWLDFMIIEEDLPEEAHKALFECTFLPWMLFSWVPNNKSVSKQFNLYKTITASYLDTDKAKNLTGYQKRFLE